MAHNFARTQELKTSSYTKYTDEIDVTAFENPDGRIEVVILNRTSDPVSVVLRIQEEIVKLKIEGTTISTGILKI